MDRHGDKRDNLFTRKKERKIKISNRRKGFNRYKIMGDTTVIYVVNRKQESFEILIDTKNLDKLLSLDYRWFVHYMKNNGKYYAHTTLHFGSENGKQKMKQLAMHRIIMDAKRGDIVDHKDPDRTLDNRESNLRITTNDKNTKNRKGKNSNNTSGYRNVSWDSRSKDWMVQLQDENGKNHTWRHFKSAEEAAGFAEKKRKEWYGEFAGKN